MRWRTLSAVGWAAPPFVFAALVAGALVWIAGSEAGPTSRPASASGQVASASAVRDEAPIETADRPVEVGKVVLVGDSLAQEAEPFLTYLVAPAEVVPKFWGGTAPCDWLDADLEADATTAVVISFTGNSLTSCMSDGSDGFLHADALVARYRADVTALVDRAQAGGATVVLIGQPVRAARFDADLEVAGINDVYRSLAAELDGVSYFDAGAAVEAPDGSFTERLPCSPYDLDCSADGTAVVRGDGVHFCPVAGGNPCPVWSGGAFRFALGLAEAAQHPQRYD